MQRTRRNEPVPEKQTKPATSEPDPKKQTKSPASPPLLCSRAEAGRLLGCSVGTIIRLEREGLLTPVRLRRKTTGSVFYKYAEVAALAEGGEGDQQAA